MHDEDDQFLWTANAESEGQLDVGGFEGPEMRRRLVGILCAPPSSFIASASVSWIFLAFKTVM
jgi:hypothetical protein